MVSDGQAGLDAMLAGVQAKFPGFVLKRISKVDSHNNAVRFGWSLGPAAGPSVVEGVDFATLSADAYPAIWKLPQDQFACVTGSGDLRKPTGDDWLEWNAGRARARDLMAERPIATTEPAGDVCHPAR